MSTALRLALLAALLIVLLVGSTDALALRRRLLRAGKHKKPKHDKPTTAPAPVDGTDVPAAAPTTAVGTECLVLSQEELNTATSAFMRSASRPGSAPNASR